MEKNIEYLRNSSRIYGITMFDFVLSYLAAFVIYEIFSLKKYINKINFYSSIIPLSIVTHYIFNVKTSFYNGLFKDYNKVYWVILITSVIFTFKK